MLELWPASLSSCWDLVTGVGLEESFWSTVSTDVALLLRHPPASTQQHKWAQCLLLCLFVQERRPPDSHSSLPPSLPSLPPSILSSLLIDEDDGGVLAHRILLPR